MSRRRGFTFVEVLFGTAVMVGFAAALFHLYRATNRQASLASWTSEAQKELRSALKRAHDELTKASYWTKIKPSAVVVLDPNGNEVPSAAQEATVREEYWVSHDTGSTGASITTTYVPDASTQQLISWYQCSPRQEGFAGTNDPGYRALCALFLDANQLVFRRERDATFDPGSQVVPITAVLAHNVESVTVIMERKQDAADAVQGSVVTLHVTVHHPNRGLFPNSRIHQEITCRVPVGFQGQT